MKALTIWQPWASLIMAGAKPFEFRGYRAPRFVIGERIVVHAGVRPCKREEVTDLLERLADPEEAWTTGLVAELAVPVLEQALSDAAKPTRARVLKRPPDLLGDAVIVVETIAPLNLPLGAGLGTVLIGDPVDGWTACERMGRPVNDSDRSQHSNFGWPMLAITPWAAPVPCRGAQGFWDWPEGGDAGRFAASV